MGSFALALIVMMLGRAASLGPTRESTVQIDPNGRASFVPRTIPPGMRNIAKMGKQKKTHNLIVDVNKQGARLMKYVREKARGVPSSWGERMRRRNKVAKHSGRSDRADKMLIQQDFAEQAARVNVDQGEVSTQTVARASANADSSEGKGRNVAVCIVGQFSRLELKSKLQNVFEPLSQENHTVHAFVVLESGEAFVNLAGASICHSNSTYETMKHQLAPFYRSGSFPALVSYNANASRWLRYLTDKPELDRNHRLQLHMSAQSNIKLCSELIEDYEVKHNISYDMVLKLRDNTVVLKPFSVMRIEKSSEFVLTKACSSWGGLNDKVMVTPRRYLKIALGGVHAALFGVEQDDQSMVASYANVTAIFNPETLLKSVLEHNAVPVRALSEEDLPFVDARCHNDNDSGEPLWCPVSELKDCRPQRPWTFEVVKQCPQ